MTNGKVIILSAPSGAGKTTILRRIMDRMPCLDFSISATSRPPRANEVHGCDYFFLNEQEFTEAVAKDRFVEWEEVYSGTRYGTLRDEVQRIWSDGKAIIFDVDVMGGIRLKEIYGSDGLSIFIMPPTLESLRERLEGRGTEDAQSLAKRVAKAAAELEQAAKFDRIVVNDNLDTAIDEVAAMIEEFLQA